MAQLPETEPSKDIPLEGFTPLMGQLANMQDLLWMLIYAVIRADPNNAPRTPRPVYPHVKRRDDMQRSRLQSAVSKLLGGD